MLRDRWRFPVIVQCISETSTFLRSVLADDFASYQGLTPRRDNCSVFNGNSKAAGSDGLIMGSFTEIAKLWLITAIFKHYFAVILSKEI